MRTTALVLWVGREVYVATEDDIQRVALPSGDASPAVADAIRQLAPNARAVRVGYHLPELRVAAVECARGDRAVLRATLGEEHPALLNPLTTWAASPIQSDGMVASTLLWIDPSNTMPRLRSVLEREGKTLEGAWPLADVMAAVGTQGSGRSAVVALIVESIGILYSSTKAGSRNVVWTRQADVHEELGKLARTVATQFDPGDPPEVTLIDAGSEPWDLSQSPIADFSTHQIELRELFSALAKASRACVSNFCPPPRPQFGLIALFASAAVIALVGLVNGALYARDLVRMNGDSMARVAAIKELRESNEHLAKNRDAIQALRDFEKELGGEQVGRLRLVEIVASAKPREITIRSIRIAEGRFEIDGTAHEGVGQSMGPFYVFLDRLVSSDGKLQFDPDSRPAALASAEFALKGRWQ